MKRSELSDVAIFVEVARANGFRAAADNLKLKAGSVSEAIRRFEERLGVRLFERSTRTVVLTPIGEQLYRRSAPAMKDLESAVLELSELRDTVSGTLRLSAPHSAASFFLDDLVARFAARYPGVSVEVIYDDRKIELIESRVDATIRAQTLLEPETHAVPIGPELKMSVLGSPAYLDHMGSPAVPSDVLDHDGICFAIGEPDSLAPWNFEENDSVYSVMPRPRMVANDVRSLLKYAEAGLGLTYIYSEAAKDQIGNGRLVEVLVEYVPSMPRYSLNFVTKRHMTKRLRAFIDMAK